MQNRDAIVDAVKARGYFEGWSDEQLIARNVVKLVEEVCEAVLAASISAGFGLLTPEIIELEGAARDLMKVARSMFDGGDCGVVVREDALFGELNDTYVVECCLESLLGVDIARGALGKATRDVERGVR